VTEIAANADRGFEALQQCSYDGLIETIQRSWELNQRLDTGTNPGEVQVILDRCGNDLAATKLLGAGGGGFLLMFARSEDAANRIRERLTSAPPNQRARFVDFSVSDSGLQLTRS
jgi:galactokinase/mevalonate kinase-like predicted kinase